MTRRQALALSLAGAALAPVALAQSPVGLPRTILPPRDALARVGLTKAWYGAVPLGYGTERLQALNLAGTYERIGTGYAFRGILFAQTNRGNLHAYESETGKYLWNARLGRDTPDARPVSVNSDRVFATNGQSLTCLDKGTGSVVWTTNMEGTATGATAANEERVMVGLASGKIVAYNVRDHTNDQPPGRSPGTFAWAWQTGGTITARPITAERVAAFASQDGKVYSVQDQPSTILYRYRTGGPVVASMGTLGTRTLVVPSMDRNLYGIDLYTGETKFKVATGAPLDQEPIASNDVVFAINQAGRLVAVEGSTGRLAWSATIGGGRLVALGATRAYAMTADGDLAYGDRRTGRILASARETRDRIGLDLRDYDLVPTNSYNDRLYLATRSGFMLCLREAEAAVPVPLNDPQAPRFGYLPPGGDEPPATPPAAPAGDEAEPAAGDEPPADGR